MGTWAAILEARRPAPLKISKKKTLFEWSRNLKGTMNDNTIAFVVTNKLAFTGNRQLITWFENGMVLMRHNELHRLRVVTHRRFKYAINF